MGSTAGPDAPPNTEVEISAEGPVAFGPNLTSTADNLTSAVCRMERLSSQAFPRASAIAPGVVSPVTMNPMVHSAPRGSPSPSNFQLACAYPLGMIMTAVHLPDSLEAGLYPPCQV